MSDVSRAFRLARRPVGLPTRDDWEYTEDPVGEPEDGEIVVDVLYISLDPAMRGWMNDSRSYIAAVGIGDVMRALAVGRVAASKHPDVAVGDHVTGLFGVQSRLRVQGGAVGKADPEIAPLPVWLGALGMPGMTAYFGLLDIGQPQEGRRSSSPARPAPSASSSARSRS